MGYDFRDFQGHLRPIIVNGNLILAHSAKGSEWDEHKYIKRVDGTYYYPESYKGGRHLSDIYNKMSPEEKANWEKNLKAISEGIEDLGGWEEYVKLMGSNDYSKGGDELSNFSLFIGEFGGIDPDKLTKDQLKALMDDVKSTKSKAGKLASEDVDALAKEVIRGNFGNGKTRKDLLGENYKEIQKKVNEMLKGSVGSKKVSETSDDSSKKSSGGGGGSSVQALLDKLDNQGYNTSNSRKKYK